MKRFILLVVAMVMTLSIADATAATKKAKSTLVTTTLSVHLHCEGCVTKAMNYIPYRKGVKDVDLSLEKKQAVITYDSKKTSEAEIIKAFEKIDLPAHACHEKGKKK